MRKVGFECPKCGTDTISINIKNREATVKCGLCDIDKTIKVNRIAEPIDVYGDLIDEIYEGRVKQSNGVSWKDMEKGYLES